jgi:hypothetical protein
MKSKIDALMDPLSRPATPLYQDSIHLEKTYQAPATLPMLLGPMPIRNSHNRLSGVEEKEGVISYEEWLVSQRMAQWKKKQRVSEYRGVVTLCKAVKP